MRYLAVLGRVTELCGAELKALYGDSVRMIGQEMAIFDAPDWRTKVSPRDVDNSRLLIPNIDRLGGTMKLGYLLTEPLLDFLGALPEGKITLGVSDYSHMATRQSTMKKAMTLKKHLTRMGRSVRVLNNQDARLSTATSHHNQLGEKTRHIEVIIVNKETYISIGTQNISAYAQRDQRRPARDAKVGMLPPKLAQILINLCGVLPTQSRVLDPFCGTGVVLQEAMLMGYRAYGTDLSNRMVSYSAENLKWLFGSSSHHNYDVSQGDATDFQWQQPVDAVACETYLGPPMSQPPADIKLKAVKLECRDILLGFLKNISGQLQGGAPLALATPAWLRSNGHYSGLNLLDEIESLGYNVAKYSNSGSTILYYREGQVVAREIIVLRKK